MIDNRAPTRTWSLRRDLKDFVRTDVDDQVHVFVNGCHIYVSRPTARLLAKRINECLDATVTR